ncbi:double-strand break repair protein AddB [Thalassorhabdomicrobium marinisediminis]|uniref:double-strand break repair protein AddB n=1 Tax=Thalassorhabdomicrobium marinisediminis TaxID=2170577 RepID=UPI0024900BB9|nr:double-strand break repair protein AddB [Thalassorhabdomicrobium marinisediminis]
MFESSATPRVFAVPLGADFSTSLYDGLRARFRAMPPEAVAQVEVFVNTRRMQRRLTELFQRDDALLLPRIRLVTDLGTDVALQDIPPAVAPLRRRLEVAQLVKGLLEVDPTLAAQTAAFDLADSLVDLMGEMQGEDVPPEAIAGLNLTDQSGHWERALAFINLVQRYFSEDAQPDVEGRQRRVVEAQIARWADSPPRHPIIVAGSTGSRGTTLKFMQAVAQLPQGAVILPGVDMDMPGAVWDRLSPAEDGAYGAEDHPQYRFKIICDGLGPDPTDLPLWLSDAPRGTARTALISLSMRPAPVTDQWITDGPALGNLEAATARLSMIEAPTPRAEADAIALRLRLAVEEGQTAALISPDRMLTRQVTAALDRWRIVPDDSAGLPLQLTAPGRFLRHVADALCEPVDAERLLVILRHPLCNSDQSDRGPHTLLTNALELHLRRHGPPYPTHESMMAWADENAEGRAERVAWADWISRTLLTPQDPSERHLDTFVRDHLQLAQSLAAGPAGTDTGELWRKAAGREALRVMGDVQTHAEAGGAMTPREYRDLIGSILATGEVRDRDAGHQQVLIWGTLEARVQSADLVILGGLNEGTWPEAPTPDPWLNRPLRKQAGLLLPERRIGLSAHDYQQAVCADEVVLSRAVRSDEAETVPSRWINRLTNLLGGLGAQNGPACLTAMKARGQVWLDMAERIATPDHQIDPAPRPSPAPPTDARPTQLSVTQIGTLIRDPYAIYGRKVLKLNALDPLAKTADAPLRGVIVHAVLEQFITRRIDPHDPGALRQMLQITDEVLADTCPWPAVRVQWRARIARFLPHFLQEEQERQSGATNIGVELWGEMKLNRTDFKLVAKADRIDKTEAGEALIYDYKTGTPPSAKQQKQFDLQLLLEAVMVEKGAFKDVGALRTQNAVYIGLGSKLANQPAPLDEEPTHETERRFEELIRKWMDPAKGYTSRRANESIKFEGDYDHLARYGEWGETDDPVIEDLS